MTVNMVKICIVCASDGGECDGCTVVSAVAGDGVTETAVVGFPAAVDLRGVDLVGGC